MSLSEDEIEMLARRRMLKNLLNDILDVVRKESPQLARRIDEVMEEYETRAARECGGAPTAEETIDCIMEIKQEMEPRLRDDLRR